jgi:hypothetical protein
VGVGERQLDATVRMGEGFLDALQGRRPTGLVATLQRAVPMLPTATGGCGCDIPPPCWVPRELGEVRSRVCARGTATVRVGVTNRGASASQVALEARPVSAGVAIDPLRWTVGVASRAGDRGHEVEVEVEDCRDLAHYRSDHFYCERPCADGAD